MSFQPLMIINISCLKSQNVKIPLVLTLNESFSNPNKISTPKTDTTCHNYTLREMKSMIEMNNVDFELHVCFGYSNLTKILEITS